MPQRNEVDDYIAALPAERRKHMSDIRAAVRAGAPDADEAISYNMPGLKLGGTLLVSYGAFKSHYSLFPWNDAMRAELGNRIEPYISGKGTIRFSADEPIPSDLVRRIAEIRVRSHTPGRRSTPK